MACVPGHFKASNGSGTCEACAYHYYNDVAAATACESCVELLNSDGAITDEEGSDSAQDCVCSLAMGYLGVVLDGQRTCAGCGAGTFAAVEGCQNCTGGQFADVAGLTACKDCPANASSYDYPHVACQCHAGYYCASGNITCPIGDCVACGVDTFKNYTGGASECDVCHVNSQSVLKTDKGFDCNLPRARFGKKLPKVYRSP